MKYFQRVLTHWSTYATALGTVAAFLTPALDVYMKAHPHTTFSVLIGAALMCLHSMPPGQNGNGSNANQQSLKAIALVGILLLAASVPSRAQTTTPAPLANLYGGGISYNNAGSPSVAGTALWAHLVNDGSGTYAFGVFDALPTSLKPFTVTTNISAGVAQKLFTLGKVDIFVPTSAGVSFQGSNTGWAWTTGGMGVFKISGNWYAMPSVRVAKSSVSNGTGYQLIPGIYFGWGK